MEIMQDEALSVADTVYQHLKDMILSMKWEEDHKSVYFSVFKA